jgi:hypothetical protein
MCMHVTVHLVLGLQEHQGNIRTAGCTKLSSIVSKAPCILHLKSLRPQAEWSAS